MERERQQRFLQQQQHEQQLRCVPGRELSAKSAMVLLQDIIDAYFSARKNKRKSPDQVEFELHWEMYCVQIYRDIKNHSFRPTAYTFVCMHPKPREVFASDMKTRILHHYLDLRLRPLLEARLSKHSFNNRIGMGTDACINALIEDICEVSENYTKEAYIMKLDVHGCFPNVNQDISYRQLEEVVLKDYNGYDKDELIYILQVCVFSYPTHHCFRKSHLSKWRLIEPSKSLFNKPDGIGAAIGHLIWQNAVNYYFHEVDEYLDRMGIRFERYVDDIYIVHQSKDILLVVPVIRELLAKVGLALHPHKFYFQPVRHGVECLGSHIKQGRVYLNNRVIHNATERIRHWNKCPRMDKMDKFIASTNSCLGLLRNRTEHRKILEVISGIDKEWYAFVRYNPRRKILQPVISRRHRLISKYNLL